MTEQRKVLLQHVFERHQHFDVDELIEQLPKRGEAGHVSRPTVYRTLNEFVEAGLLRRFELDGRSVYEHDYGYPAHDHFYCDKSGKLIEFHNRELVELIEKIAQQYDFQIASHRLIIYGASKEGREASRRTKRLPTVSAGNQSPKLSTSSLPNASSISDSPGRREGCFANMSIRIFAI